MANRATIHLVHKDNSKPYRVTLWDVVVCEACAEVHRKTVRESAEKFKGDIIMERQWQLEARECSWCEDSDEQTQPAEDLR